MLIQWKLNVLHPVYATFNMPRVNQVENSHDNITRNIYTSISSDFILLTLGVVERETSQFLERNMNEGYLNRVQCCF